MKKLFVLTVFCLSIALAGDVFATVAGGWDPANPDFPDHEFTVQPGATVQIDLGDVAWGDSAGPIIKKFTMTGAGNITLVETIHVSGTVAWTDWDEQIMVPGPVAGTWVPSPDTDLLEWIAPVTVVGAGAGWTWTDDEPNDILVIDFNPPVVPSTDLTITKTIANPNGVPVFQIWEWPTVPEPSIALVGIGLLGLMRRKK